jgi:signal transduction histidine kinase
MKRLFGSLGARLAWGAVVMITIALVLAGIGISLVLHRFIVSQLDHRLDEKILAVSSMLDAGADGVQVRPTADGPPFDRPFSGWYWEVRQGDGRPTVQSASLAGGEILVHRPHFRWQEFWNLRPRPAEGRGPRGEPLHLRVASVPVGNALVTIIASAPGEAIARPMFAALTPVFLSLLLLGVALAAASFFQVRLGLRPIKALQASLADIRAGRAAHVPADQPAELKPLTDELNTLLDQNSEGPERARRNVANLAHSLKTPLATLAVSLQQSHETDMLRQVEQMERHIRHHLGRARAAALGGPSRARTEIAPRIADLAAMFAKVHADRNIAFTSSVGPDVAVACEAQDLDEMLGNVVDNAFKWSRSRVSVSHLLTERGVSIVVEDDGPGLKDDQSPEALLPGRRLDETVPGDGFGLAIVRELAELYNGGIALGRSELGGLRVVITLPLPRG